jgi:hypothetical protein
LDVVVEVVTAQVMINVIRQLESVVIARLECAPPAQLDVGMLAVLLAHLVHLLLPAWAKEELV